MVLGICVDANTNPQLAKELGAPTARGVVVWRIHQESAAARAGLEPGDIIVTFNGSPLEDGSDYSRLLSDAEIGSSVTLEVIRDGQHIDFTVLVSQSRPNERTRR